MSDFIKKLSVGAYFIALGGIATVVALIIAIISNGHTGYEMSNMAITVILSICGIACAAGIIFFAGTKKNNIIVSVLEIAMVIALTFCIWTMVYGKMDVFGTVLLSDLEKGFIPAEKACYQGVACIIVYLVATLITIVGSFMSAFRKN